MAESLLRGLLRLRGGAAMALAIGRCSEFSEQSAQARARSDELRYLNRCRFYGTQFLNLLHLLVLFEFLHKSAQARERRTGPGHYGAATGGWLLCTAPWPL